MSHPYTGPRTCAHCRFWASNYVGAATWGWCMWREELKRNQHPRMNRDTHFRLTSDGGSLETRHDAACVQFEPDCE